MIIFFITIGFVSGTFLEPYDEAPNGPAFGPSWSAYFALAYDGEEGEVVGPAVNLTTPNPTTDVAFGDDQWIDWQAIFAPSAEETNVANIPPQAEVGRGRRPRGGIGKSRTSHVSVTDFLKPHYH